MNYSEVYLKLTYETACIVFVKKDGTIRTMLGTRNPKTMALNDSNAVGALSGHDKRCNIHNGNIALYDLVIGEPRSFNIERMTSIYWCGQIETMEALGKTHEEFALFEQKYKQEEPKVVSLDMLEKMGYRLEETGGIAGK